MRKSVVSPQIKSGTVSIVYEFEGFPDSKTMRVLSPDFKNDLGI